MKDKVIVFTENNARILINPRDLRSFEGKENAFINPDLSFVKGLEPHYWKLINGENIPLQEARQLLTHLSAEIDWSEENPDYQQMFYKELYHGLREEIEASEKSASLVARLLEKASHIQKVDITKSLQEKLVKPSKNAAQTKENKAFNDLIKTWHLCNIIPMDEEERVLRDKNIVKYGISNKAQEKQKGNKLYWLMAITLFVAIAYIKYKTR